MPFLIGLGSWVSSAIVNNGKTIFKLFLFGTFIAMVTAFSVWFVGFTNDLYSLIIGSVSMVSDNYSGTLGCVLEKLGLIEFMNSFFSIFYSAVIFWITAVGYIITYKFSVRAYDGIFKSLS